MPETPRFSITVPAYNAEATLGETVASVRAQTFSDWELVIVDDGSTDGTLALAREFAAPDVRIRVVTQENRGSGGAYNTAVREASGDLLVMLSADDLLLPDHLVTLDAFINEHPEASVFTCDGYFEYEDGRLVSQDLNDRWRSRGSCELADLLHACFYGIGAVYRRAVYDGVGGFRENIYAEDYIFWLFALANGFQHRLVDVPLAVHRRHSAQKSSAVVRVRQADVTAIQAVCDSGLLGPHEREVADQVIQGHKRAIGVRRSLARLLGQGLSDRVLGSLGSIRRRLMRPNGLR